MLCGALNVQRFLTRHRPRILVYHRISNQLYTSGISIECFEKQMAYIKKRLRIISVSQLVDESKKVQLQPHTLALTFDDGYADFYYNAWPILRKYNIPATLYVPSGFADQSQWLWPDLIKIYFDRSSKYG